ncbi:heterokaryon incompatibility protein-domain-containing protein [Triangularia setosa]|uniref:Heterokaryon incompatibility protein-domain-containing protein n=1 Tax=Triangularia setosa TaxID=2587417 RepID=A0AAN6VYA0_9PEZI|nr:heterokaryon incompatibility protein-domain-containing protein [Podospora setosa]
MRLKNEPLTLWVDAICINQKDNPERSVQIRIMKDIYRTALAISIWLGHGDEHSSLVMRLIHFAAELYNQPREQAHDNLVITDIMNYALNRTNLQTLASFFTKDWRGQIWVIQEAVVARRALFVCGDETLGFQDFGHACFYWAALLKLPFPKTRSQRFSQLGIIVNGISPRGVL